MDDPRRKGARAPTYGDRNEHRRRTPAAGTPVYVDPEETPPPQLPPQPDEEGFGPRLSRLEAGVEQLITGIGRLWDVRKDGDRLDRIDKKLGDIATVVTRHDASLTEFVVPGIKDTIGAVDEVARQMPRLIGQVEAVVLHVTALDKRVHDLELEMRISGERAANSALATQTRLSSVENVQNALDVRLTKLEQRDRDEKVAERAIAKSDKRRLALVRTGWIALVAVVSFLMSHLAQIKSLFTGGS